MERNEFLKMCQKVSLLPDGIMHTKKDVPKELRVVCEGNEYYPVYHKLKFEKGKVLNIGVVHDLKANCEIDVPLDLVEKLINESE